MWRVERGRSGQGKRLEYEIEVCMRTERKGHYRRVICNVISHPIIFYLSINFLIDLSAL